MTNLALKWHPPFAQKIEINDALIIFNVHLMAFKNHCQCKTRCNPISSCQNECESTTTGRASQIEMLGKHSQDGDYFCGDFNMIRNALNGTCNRPSMDGITWLEIAEPTDPETYYQVTDNLLSGVKEYDYIGIKGNYNPKINRKVLTPGNSGGKGTYRHHPIKAEISIQP